MTSGKAARSAPVERSDARLLLQAGFSPEIANIGKRMKELQSVAENIRPISFQVDELSRALTALGPLPRPEIQRALEAAQLVQAFAPAGDAFRRIGELFKTQEVFAETIRNALLVRPAVLPLDLSQLGFDKVARASDSLRHLLNASQLADFSAVSTSAFRDYVADLSYEDLRGETAPAEIVVQAIAHVDVKVTESGVTAGLPSAIQQAFIADLVVRLIWLLLSALYEDDVEQIQKALVALRGAIETQSEEFGRAFGRRQYRATAKVRMRAQPTTESTIIRSLEPGEEVAQVGLDGRWVLVRYQDEHADLYGWVYGRYLEVVEEGP